MALLKEVQRIILQMETNTSIYEYLEKAKMMYYTYRQDASDSNAKNLRKFKSIIASVKYQGGQIFANKALLNHKRDADIEIVGGRKRTYNERRTCVREKLWP